MKSNIAVFACLVVAATLILPTVCAGSMTGEAWTDDDEYTRPDPVNIFAWWAVTDPTDFDHDRCHVLIVILHLGTQQDWELEGWYYVPERKTSGEVPVYCLDKDGFADYWWDTTAKPLGDYEVDVTATAYDDSQSPPNNVITKDDYATLEFTLS